MAPKTITLALACLLPQCTPTLAEADPGSCLYARHQGSILSVRYAYEGTRGEKGTVKGSGFIITQDGYALTAYHVVEPDPLDKVSVVRQTASVRIGGVFGPELPVAVVSTDPQHDLALLKLPAQATPWPTVPLGHSEQVTVGASVAALGYPGEGDLTLVPASIVTSKNSVVEGQLKPFLQTALGLQRGDSGGPVFGADGTVIGVMDEIYTDEAHPSAISYVTPIQLGSALTSQAGAAMASRGPCAWGGGQPAPGLTSGSSGAGSSSPAGGAAGSGGAGYGIVLSGDAKLSEAEYEIKLAKSLTGGNFRLYWRQNLWRSVQTFDSKEQAQSALATIKSGRWRDAYSVSLDVWCPTPTSLASSGNTPTQQLSCGF